MGSGYFQKTRVGTEVNGSWAADSFAGNSVLAGKINSWMVCPPLCHHPVSMQGCKASLVQWLNQ